MNVHYVYTLYTSRKKYTALLIRKYCFLSNLQMISEYLL